MITILQKKNVTQSNLNSPTIRNLASSFFQQLLTYLCLTGHLGQLFLSASEDHFDSSTPKTLIFRNTAI